MNIAYNSILSKLGHAYMDMNKADICSGSDINISKLHGQ